MAEVGAALLLLPASQPACQLGPECSGPAPHNSAGRTLPLRCISLVPKESHPPPLPGAAVEERNIFHDTHGKKPPHWGHLRR